MNTNEGWQFPDNNCTKNYGLEDSDTETFAGDADGSLAREICQNSIDANNEKGLPTKVVFKSFVIKTKDIPGYDRLREEIDECCAYKGEDPKEGKQLQFIKKALEQENVNCLRISDFNTTGLVGIMDDENDSPFYLLTKGSGTSGKREGNGGSKGIGKYACFVASDLRTVFYSTKAWNSKKNREEIGYIGISKLRSRPMHNPERPNLMTMGTGYYAINRDNAPYHEELLIDPNFKRKENEYGTDVYLMGYNSKKWKTNIVYKILEGFMGAIVYKGFEAEVDDIKINKDTLSAIIDSDLFSSRTANERKWLKAQYSLFMGDGVQKQDFIIGDNNKITIYVKSYNQKNENESSKRCEFIRYPYMRIKKLKIQTMLPYSAMCIIENNNLCEKLRNIEDPAHTDWQFNRLKKHDTEDERETRNLYNEMESQVKNYIHECLRQEKSDEVDLEGAGEYLSSDEESIEDGGNGKTNEAIAITPVRKVKVNVPKTAKSSEDGMGPGFSTGDPNGNDGEMIFPKPGDSTSKPNPYPKSPIDDEKHGGSNGGTPAVVKVPLGGMKYKAIYDDKNKNFDIIFVSKYTEKDCELAIKEVGLKDDRYDVKILSASINGNACVVEDGVIKNFQIEEGKKIKISCKVDTDERFASEVILNAIR